MHFTAKGLSVQCTQTGVMQCKITEIHKRVMRSSAPPVWLSRCSLHFTLTSDVRIAQRRNWLTE